MAFTLNAVAFDDPLIYLRRAPLQQFPKRHTIYGPDHVSERLYVVVHGRVKVTNAADNGITARIRVVTADGLFGESCLVGLTAHNESAVALDNLTVMSWPRQDIEEQIERNPQLGLALSQYFVHRCGQLQNRIIQCMRYTTRERVMLALLQLASEGGAPLAGAFTRMAPLSHTTIAEYIGTSREVVSAEMNRLRRRAMLQYSRRFIDVNAEAIRHELALLRGCAHLSQETAAELSSNPQSWDGFGEWS